MKKRISISSKFLLLVVFVFGSFINCAIAIKSNSFKSEVRQQQIEITGTVTDVATGDPLPGVNIVVEGTNIGTTTNMDGEYTIEAPADATLIVSSVGYQEQRLEIKGRQKINVELTPSVEEIDEVVVTALGLSREKKSLGYSVSEVSGESIEKITQENVMNSLSGRVAGVAINSTGGTGSTVSMVIRGASSLTSDNQPLFVVDGVPVNNTLANVGETGARNEVDYGSAIGDIDASNVESISVLKGPSAAALYGSRAGNGVVLITTKSGRDVDEMRVEITSNTVFETPYAFLDVHSKFANGRRPYTQDARPDNGLPYYDVPSGDSYWCGPELDKGQMGYVWPFFNEDGELEAKELVSYPDNLKEFFQTAFTTTNGFAVSNSIESLNYRLSYNNMQHKGNIPNTDLNRNSLTLNSSAKLLDNLRLNSSINYKNSGAANRASGNRSANPMANLYRRISPSIDIDDLKDYWLPGQEGIRQRGPYNLTIDPVTGELGSSSTSDNPYFLANEINNAFRRDRIHGFAQLEWEILPQLQLMGRFAHDQYNEKRESSIALSYQRDPNGVYGLTDLYRRESNADFLLSYDNTFDVFTVTASAGGNYMYRRFENRYDQTKSRGGGISVPGVWSLNNINSDNLNYGSSWSQKAIYSLYGQASFGYNDMIYLDLTARNDWSSTLPKENHSYFYPSASLSVLANNLFDMGGNVSLAKIRAGWAQVGNDTDPYRLNSTMGSQSAWLGQTRMSTPGSLLLPDLKPEIQTSWEIGAELAFYQNRLRFEGTYYKAENENQILGIGLPPSSGYSSRQINAGLISSRGYELMVGGSPLRTNDWLVDMNFVYSWNRTKIEELAEGYDYYVFWTNAKGGAVTRVGDEIGQIVDDPMIRVDDPDSEYHGWPLLTSNGGPQAGKWEDYMEPGDNTAVIGNFNPDFQLGMQTSVSFRNWSLGANFDWRKGGQFVSQSYRYMESDYLTNRWIDRTVKINDLSPAEQAQYLRDNADKYLSPDGEFWVIVGGPTEDYGGLPHTEGGITLTDGNFMPGVSGSYDDNGNFVMDQEHLGDEGTPKFRWQNTFGWSHTENSLFDADFIKLRELSLTYQIPRKQAIGLQNASVTLYSRNLILWTKAGINVDPERAFQLSGSSFDQGVELFNVNPWTIPVGIRLNVTF
ncbi:MAG: SusC/RagA family TonB-linked outer membrane protein [Bacteroidales bacterium]|nr:SusC/RagA family TonB-linked outer membrane protein [Bacteroidales bacterium]